MSYLTDLPPFRPHETTITLPRGIADDQKQTSLSGCRRGRKTRGQVRFLRLPEVLARTGLVAEHDRRAAGARRFPRPVSLGSRAVGWVEAEVDEWMRERIAASRRSVE